MILVKFLINSFKKSDSVKNDNFITATRVMELEVKKTKFKSCK